MHLNSYKKSLLLMNSICKILILLIATLIVSCSDKEKKLTSKDICEDKLPPFVEKFDDQFDKEKLKLLCNCIWSNFPEDGWERKVSEKLYNGEDIGWKIKSFSSIFETNLKKCKLKIR